ncbi:aldo/keto reductase [Micromonospora lupini]|uniref:Putative Aldo/keto reductase n=1 Tax=Micromonospora lupini str. Lupac 08 TaxID=1150864 RepID=I0KW15_9ACTN|nr:aldo/keto reductase [Micromonospora lupini]CCH15762.1 Putative Aldo/keto reductase [Micromonospora lupini str. Lupac 08]
MRTVQLGGNGPHIGIVGLGCMGMSWGYDDLGRDDSTSMAVIHRALEIGMNLIDTSDQYGPFVNERLVGRALRDRRDQAVLATKGGLVVDGAYKTYRNGRPEHLRAACEASLGRLGVDHVDLYQLHRVDPNVPIEESWGALAELVQEGKVRALGLSEASVDEISRAAAVHPVASVQTELSLWSREALDEVVPYCTANGITFIAYSPLGRGFLTDRMNRTEDLPEVDGRHRHPRFQAAALAANQAIMEPVRRTAAELGVQAAQVALAWVLAQGNEVVALPGTKTLKYLEVNAAAADITLPQGRAAELAEVPDAVGTRY